MRKVLALSIGMVMLFWIDVFVLPACRSFGKLATAENQGEWSRPCETRGPQYAEACVDDPTIPSASLQCPCHE